jgi:hypothetical protein
MRRVRFGAATALVLLLAAACAKPDIDPIQLDGMRLTVDNTSGQDWADVEIWINRQFRMKVPAIKSGQRLQTQLDLFVTGYGRRFEFGRMQLNDLRLNGKRPDGSLFELRKQLAGDPLADALKGIGGKR